MLHNVTRGIGANSPFVSQRVFLIVFFDEVETILSKWWTGLFLETYRCRKEGAC